MATRRVFFFFLSCEKGGRQGKNLSPLLLAVYLNDLEKFLTDNGCHGVDININAEIFFVFVKLLVILYADDTIILSDDAECFQEVLNTFNEYCANWNLKINESKTKNMISGDYSRKRATLFSIDGHVIETVKEIKY